MNKPLWKNVSGTFTFKIDGRLVTIQAGETFRAEESQIPKAFRDTIVKIEEATPEPEQTIEPAEVKVTDTKFARDKPVQKKAKK